jgi:glutamine amidotransferase
MIAIIDYQMGNINSVARKLNKLGVAYVVTNNPTLIETADRIILPGVGHFGNAMQNLKKLELLGALNKFALVDKKPVLGICLGMQLMTQSSEEGNQEGLGWFNCTTEKLSVEDQYAFKLPHIGWNTITAAQDSQILMNIPDGSEVYFVHNYGVYSAPKEEQLTISSYERPIISGLIKNNIIGMQFHPEKSHDVGFTLLRNFLEFI